MMKQSKIKISTQFRLPKQVALMLNKTLFSVYNTHSAAFDTFDGNENLNINKNDLNTFGMTYRTLEQLSNFNPLITGSTSRH